MNFQGRLDSRTQLNQEARREAEINAANAKAVKDAEAANAAAAVALFQTRKALIDAKTYTGPRNGAEETVGERLLSYCDPIEQRHRDYSQAMCEETGMLALGAANETLVAQGKKPLDANEVELVIAFLIGKNVWAGAIDGSSIYAGAVCLMESGAIRKELKRVMPTIQKVPAKFPGDAVLCPDEYSRWEKALLKQEQDEQDVIYIQNSPAWQAAIQSLCDSGQKEMGWPAALKLLEVFRQMSAHENRHGRPMHEDVAGIRKAARAVFGDIGELPMESGEKAFDAMTSEQQRRLLNSADTRDARYAETGQWHDSRTMRQR